MLVETAEPLFTDEEIEFWSNAAALAKIDPWYWLTHFTYTKDEHDPTVLRKPFPVRAMYRVLCRAWNEFDVLFMDKSRQVRATWLYTSLHLHEAMFKFNRLIFLQSKKQEDANAVLERCRHIYDSAIQISAPVLGEWLPKALRYGERTGTDTEIEFREIGSKIAAIPQGGDIVRSYTCSRIFGDEMNHQPQFSEGFQAASPTINGGGRYIAIGTPNGHTFAYCVLHGLDERTEKKLGDHLVDSRRINAPLFQIPDQLTEEERRYYIEKMLLSIPDDEFAQIPFEVLVANTPGIEYWKTAAGRDCMRLHYSADPDKDPVTRKGNAWVIEAKQNMGSRTKWEQEMEFNYEAYVGRPVVSNWETSIFVKKPEYDASYSVLLSFDFGTQVCVCLFGQYVVIDTSGWKQMRLLRELVLYNSNTPEMAAETVRILKTEYPLAWRDYHIRAFCDPNGDREEDTTSDQSLNTNIKILKAHGIYPSNRGFGTKESTQLLETVFELKSPKGDPAIIIHERCEYMRGVFGGGLHYPERGKGREGHYEKDGIWDHGGDAARYMVANTFTQYDLTGKPAPTALQSHIVREPYTGRRVALVDPRSRRYRHNLRRGIHGLYN